MAPRASNLGAADRFRAKTADWLPWFGILVLFRIQYMICHDRKKGEGLQFGE
jgi:hypothetical protein